MGRIGIIDWGIGGIGIYGRLKQKYPSVAVTYLSDTGFTPYGKTTRRELIARLNQVLRFLEARDVSTVIIACNAASTVVDDLQKGSLEVSGVIKPAIELTTKLRPHRLGLIGGRRTVVSGVYRRGFAARGIKLSQRIAQPLSGLIESGDTNSPRLNSESKRILAPLADHSHILLACTHYPAIADVLSQFVSKETRFIDPADAVVNSLLLDDAEPVGADVFFSTGDVTEMRRAAEAAWDTKIGVPKQIRLG